MNQKHRVVAGVRIFILVVAWMTGVESNGYAGQVLAQKATGLHVGPRGPAGPAGADGALNLASCKIYLADGVYVTEKTTTVSTRAMCRNPDKEFMLQAIPHGNGYLALVNQNITLKGIDENGTWNNGQPTYPIGATFVFSRAGGLPLGGWGLSFSPADIICCQGR